MNVGETPACLELCREASPLLLIFSSKLAEYNPIALDKIITGVYNDLLKIECQEERYFTKMALRLDSAPPNNIQT